MRSDESMMCGGVMRRIRARSEAGAAAIIVALVMPVLIGIAALALDIGRERILGWQLQKAADAGALAGSVFLPNHEDTAIARAAAVVAQNVPGARVSSMVVPNHPTQLEVTVTASMEFVFAQIFGFSDTTVTRVGVGEYAAPAPMGSPCNTFGNEPPSDTVQPPGSVLPGDRSLAYNTCYNPQLWGMVEGPDVSKVQGDRYATRNCDDGPVAYYKCDSADRNTEFKPEGYFYLVRVLPDAVNQPLRLQLYDPAFVYTGQTCEELDLGGMGPRYASSGNNYCTGDSYPSSGRDYSPNYGQTRATVTSYQLRSPTLSQNPLQGTPMANCAAQFRGWSTAPTKSQLQSDADLATVFHRWYQLCTFTPNTAGDYYLQIRTNVPMLATTGGIATGSSVNPELRSSTPADDLSVRGDGANGFALRVATPPGVEDQVSVSGYQRMAMFINANSSVSTFNLIRADPSAAGKRLVFSFFDAADATANNCGRGNCDATGSFQILPPLDGGLTQAAGGTIGWSSISGCTGQLNDNATLTNLGSGCAATVTSARNNGQLYTVYVPIPQNYTCTFNSQGGCWFRVKIDFGNTQVHDVTTWDAAIQGDPVRLIPGGG